MNFKDTILYRVYYDENGQGLYTEPCYSFDEANNLMKYIQKKKPAAYDFFIVKETIIKEFVLGTVTI